MRITRIGYALGIAAAVAIAGCSSNGSSLGPIAQGPVGSQSVVRNHVPIIMPAKLLSTHQSARTTAKGFSSPDVTGTFVYGCAFSLSECVAFKHNHNTPAVTITGLLNPQGIGVDPVNANVYVADTGGSDIPVYAKGSSTPISDLSDPGQFPADRERMPEPAAARDVPDRDRPAEGPRREQLPVGAERLRPPARAAVRRAERT